MEIPNSPGDRLLLRGQEVAQLIGCSRALAYRLMQTGQLPVVRVGSKAVRVPREALVDWIRNNTVAAAGRHEDMEVSGRPGTGAAGD